MGDRFCTVEPDGDAVTQYRKAGGTGKLVQGGTKVCWGADEQTALDHVARLWPNEALPGELAQILPTPEHFEQATELVTPEMLAEQIPCRPDVDKHVAALQPTPTRASTSCTSTRLVPTRMPYLRRTPSTCSRVCAERLRPLPV